jgi:hypothetical protein
MTSHEASGIDGQADRFGRRHGMGVAPLAWVRLFVVAILAAVLAACGASGAPSPVSNALPAEAASTSTTYPTATTGTNLAMTESPRIASQAPTTRPAPEPTPVPVPPKPTGVKFDERRRLGPDPSSTEVTQTVTWAAPLSAGVEIRVYGVTKCIAEPANPSPNTNGPCLVEHTPLPGSVLTPLATAPASSSAVSWTWTGTFDCEGPGPAYDPRGPAYHAVVIAAYSASGHSIFVIAEPGRWSQPGPSETVC